MVIRATSRLAVVTTVGSSRTGRLSCASTGKTLRNHPYPPAQAMSAPRQLMDGPVTSPAKIRVSPKASTTGHAVGAGISIVLSVCSKVSTGIILTSNQIHHGEDHHPDDIHEVPVDG